MTLFSPLGIIPTPPMIGFKSIGENGITLFIGRVIGLMLILGGLFVLFNIITAGYLYIQGGSANLTKAWDKIWQSLLGIIILASAILITGIISWFVFGSPTFIISPSIQRPV